MVENRPALTLSDVSFSYPGSTPVFSSLSLNVKRGEHVFIAGSSGSGKTTLLNLIGGVLLPTEGEIDVLGTRLHSMKAAKRDSFRADSMGIIFQLFNLVPYLSVLENVLLPLRFSSKRKARLSAAPAEEAVRLLASLGLADTELHLGSCSKLSVGQQQRVAAARALIGSPELIIADEPTSALDAARQDDFLELLFKQCEEQGSTLLFVSHDHTLQERFSTIFSLEDRS